MSRWFSKKLWRSRLWHNDLQEFSCQWIVILYDSYEIDRNKAYRLKWKKPTHAHLKYSIHQFTKDLFIFRKRNIKLSVGEKVTLTVVHNMYALILSKVIRKENIYFAAFTRSLEITENIGTISIQYFATNKINNDSVPKSTSAKAQLICTYSLRRVANFFLSLDFCHRQFIGLVPYKAATYGSTCISSTY